MRTRLLIRPVIDAYVLTYSIDSSNYLQFTTSTTLQVGNTVVIDNITLPTIITDITSVSNGLYTTSTSWYDDLPVGGTIVNVLNNSDPTQAPDETFDTLNSPNGPVYTVSEVLSDSSYLIGGAFGLYQGQSYSNMVRVNEDGSVNSFFNNSTGFNDVVYTIAAQSNGDSYVGGMFTQYDGNSANKFIKLFSNGTIDTSFIVSSGFNDTVLACIDSPSGPYVFGEFTSYGGSTKRGIVKLDEFGAIDNSNFNVSTGLGTSSYATCGAIDKDEKLLVGGSFTSFNSDTCSNIMRLMQDGTFDNTFVQGSGFNDVVNCIAVLSTGDYMVGGMFTSYNGSSVSGIVKIRPNGSRNAIFSCTISGGAASILSISETNYGKFLISGNFTTVNGVTCNNLARINSDGTIDPTFTVPTGLDDTTFNIIDSSDRYLIFGEYTEYQGEGVNFLLRIAEKLYSIRFAPVDLDLKEDLQFPLNFNIADIRTPQNRKSNYSKTIDLPGTDKNSKVFAQLF